MDEGAWGTILILQKNRIFLGNLILIVLNILEPVMSIFISKTFTGKKGDI